MNIKTNAWDPSEYLESPEDVVAYLQAVLEESNDAAVFQAALGDVARAHGMSEIARTAGVGRESLYKSLRSDSHPSFETINKVVSALGGQFTIKPAPPAQIENIQ